MYVVCSASKFPWRLSTTFFKLPENSTNSPLSCLQVVIFVSSPTYSVLLGGLNLLIPGEDRCHKEKIFFQCDRKNLVSSPHWWRRRWRCGLSLCRYALNFNKHYVYHLLMNSHIFIQKLPLSFSDTGNYSLYSPRVYIWILLRPLVMGVDVQKDYLLRKLL